MSETEPRLETWTARVSSVVRPKLLIEKGWPYFVEWAPDKKDPLHCLVAVLCVHPSQEQAQALLAGGAHEPVRSVLVWLSEGHTDPSSMPTPDCWCYSDPEHKVGYDPHDVVSQLTDLGVAWQDGVDVALEAYVARELRQLCTHISAWTAEARTSPPDRMRVRLRAVSERVSRELARISVVEHAFRG